MKVLVLHCRYQNPGGEETVVQNEVKALSEIGHTVVLHELQNSSIRTPIDKILAAISAPFNLVQLIKLIALLKKEQPDVVHIHNYFPLLSPSVVYACKLLKIRQVVTLHNYRIICPTTTLFHKGQLYKEGVKGHYATTLKDRVYNDSYTGTAVVILMILLHRILRTWQIPDALIVMSNFQKNILSQRIKGNYIVLPHFTTVPDMLNELKKRDEIGSYFVFVGRLSAEKGILELIDIWPESQQLRVIGDGPLLHDAKQLCRKKPNISITGRLPKHKCLAQIKNAQATIFPSLTHETFGLVLIESFSVGTPVVVNNLPPVVELLTPDVGYTFDFSSPESLNEAIKKIKLNRSSMSDACKTHYEVHFSEKIGIERLNEVLIPTAL